MLEKGLNLHVLSYENPGLMQSVEGRFSTVQSSRKMIAEYLKQPIYNNQYSYTFLFFYHIIIEYSDIYLIARMKASGLWGNQVRCPYANFTVSLK